jgi:carboxyl-terminal processing protease
LVLPTAAVRVQPAAADLAAPPQDETPAPAAAPADVQRLAEVRTLIIQNYVRKVNDQDVTDGAIRGMVEALRDPYSGYVSSDELKALERETAGTFAGVGVQIRLEEGRITVVSPLEGSPALKAGVQPGDVILGIDGKPTQGIEIASAVKQILGTPGSPVQLKLRHPDGAEAEVTLTRSQIKVPSVKGFRRGPDDRWEYFLDRERQVGYVDVSHFTADTAKDLGDVVRKLKDQGLKGLVLDLRFCPGGLLSAAVATAQLFLSEATITTLKGNAGEGNTFAAGGDALLPDTPLVVLVNDRTSSAAEVVAGALKDNRRAIVLGTRTYGKGSVQNLFKVPGEGQLKLTTAFFYLPSGRSIHKAPGEKEWGVDPTDGYYLSLDTAQTEALLKVARRLDVLGGKSEKPPVPLSIQTIAGEYADPQLAAALKTMTAKLTEGQFVPVGRPLTALQADVAKRDELLQRRLALMKDLEQVNKELAALEQHATPSRPAPKDG